MSDTLIVALVVCLILTNLSRIKTMFLWVRDMLAPLPGPQMVPYFDEHGMSLYTCFVLITSTTGTLIGLVRIPAGINLHPHAEVLNPADEEDRRSVSQRSMSSIPERPESPPATELDGEDVLDSGG